MPKKSIPKTAGIVELTEAPPLSDAEVAERSAQ
jgi:hypothetical protein